MDGGGVCAPAPEAPAKTKIPTSRMSQTRDCMIDDPPYENLNSMSFIVHPSLRARRLIVDRRACTSLPSHRREAHPTATLMSLAFPKAPRHCPEDLKAYRMLTCTCSAAGLL